MEKSKRQDGRLCYKCNICGKEDSHIRNLRNHIESVHFPGYFSYTCDHCKKTFKTKNALCTRVERTQILETVTHCISSPVYFVIIRLNIIKSFGFQFLLVSLYVAKVTTFETSSELICRLGRYGTWCRKVSKQNIMVLKIQIKTKSDQFHVWSLCFRIKKVMERKIM